ncbi:RsiV family protein [Mucilaginibacter sp. BT774]|uniref:RsiV family protein n=1 Tax=Mucilaginibacter sp. BT774 TaxID=3062276 RepID=UPI0026746130|nr:RsiV family protein [Mucilaginibacter sp. BT774]MDO3628807.1 RsiV family protein [Mucilaginibacter sp. BT774]
MRLRGILFVIIACSLASCQWGTSTEDKPEITTDTLQFVYKHIKQKEADRQLDISYPVFKNQNTLNDSLTGYLHGQKDHNLHASVLRQDSSLTIIEINEIFADSGKSGKTQATHFLNWNTKKSKPIKLNDILIDQYTDQLNKIAEAIFRKNENLSADAPLNGYSFKGGQFVLNDNFLITPIGLKFLYNNGEAKPESYGPVALFIPYSQILNLLRPNTVITQYHK